MADERIGDRLARLEREREDADRAYNEALTALDRVIEQPVDLPHPPPPYDESMLTVINEARNILPAGPPRVDRSLKGRVRGLVWRLVGPPLEAQRHFNSAVVDHINRNVEAHREAQKAAASTIATLGAHLERQIRLQAHLIQLLQRVTLYVDSRDRLVAAEPRATLQAIAEDWQKHWDSAAARDARAAAQLATLDEVRDTAVLAQQTALSLKRDVERLLEPGSLSVAAPGTPPAVPDLDSFKYLSFEDHFRGSPAEISRRLTEYVPLFAGASDVLDLGCGRGEFLELLGAAGIRARGLDINHEMVEASRARGLDVTEGDALGYLKGLADDSLGGMFAAQVVEHLDPVYLGRVLETAGRKIRRGGVIVLETINPACWVAFFESYLRDLTHVRPLHPDTLKHLVRVSGFHTVEIQYKSPVAEWDRLRSAPKPADAPAALGDLIDTCNENVGKLNDRLFTYQDYAVVGRK